MTPEAFITKWRAASLTESAASQEQFIDLCRVLGEPTPAEDDPDGESYAFEKGASKTTGASGWADVWKRGHFAWEYKGHGKDLNAAFAQLQQYSGALGNPPLLIVSDMHRFRVYTAWTNTVSKVYDLVLEDLRDPEKLQILKWAFSDPDRLRPGLTRQALTEEAAQKFAALARTLRDRGYEATRVAHFINRLVFCAFAEDVDLLPNRMFQRMLEAAEANPEMFEGLGRQLFGAMRAGGIVGFEKVEWFNGGLFDDDAALPLEKDEIRQVLSASRMDWSAIDPSIFGTLFERGLDPDKRSQLGAHYTDREKIMMIVEPVIARPLAAEWETAKIEIQALLDQGGTPGARKKAGNAARVKYKTFLDRLRGFTVLDPACGSGNFLYLALLALKDLEHRVGIEAEVMGLEREFPRIGPECLHGIEINPYAAELARVSVWIGEIQWMRRNGFGARRNPILRPLDTIECRDAVLNEDGSESKWPRVDVIIGNPPFLGGKRLRNTLGNDYVDRLFAAYSDRVPAEADLVLYWIAKAWEMISISEVARAGLVATNSIRGGPNRRVIDAIARSGVIFAAWDDEPWVVEGAAVRVSIISFSKAAIGLPIELNGQPVRKIHADLTSLATDLTAVKRLQENGNVAFMGDTKGGAFDVPGELAREWLALPVNPNGKSNSAVLRPWANGMDVTRRPSGKWIVDFGWEMDESSASFFEAPFKYIYAHVKPERLKNNREAYRIFWWRHVEPRPGMWRAVRPLDRFIVTPEVSKHRVFAWMDHRVVPDHKLQIIARDDDTIFGVLHSRFHEAWARAVGSWHGAGNDPRYTITTCFETFAFPDGLTPNRPAKEYSGDPHAVAIAAAAKRLDELRRVWLNPPDLVDFVPEVVPGFPDRILPKNEAAAATLKKRTLTNLYNERPAWLENAHRELDAAVAAAYGWEPTISDDEALARLFELNQTL